MRNKSNKRNENIRKLYQDIRDYTYITGMQI